MRKFLRLKAYTPVSEAAFAAMDAARERARVAGESMRQRLDLKGWVEARTLGVDELSPVVTDLDQSGAYSGYVGLLYELPLDNRKKQGERAQDQRRQCGPPGPPCTPCVAPVDTGVC